MEIHTFELGSFQVSAYVVIEGDEAMIVDAPDGADEIIAFCDRRKIVPRVLVNTHGHADHIFANAAMKEHWKDLGIRPVKGQVHRVVRKGQDPKSRVCIIYGGDFAWSQAERLRFRSMLSVLNIRLREKIREEKGGTYGIWAGSSLDRYPVGAYQIRISFGCAPERVDDLIRAVQAELEWLKTTPVDELYLTKVKQMQLREREVALEQNEFWLGTLESCRWNGEDPREAILEFPKRVEALTREEIRETAAKYFGTDNVATFVLLPESAAEPK